MPSSEPVREPRGARPALEDAEARSVHRNALAGERERGEGLSAVPALGRAEQGTEARYTGARLSALGFGRL